MGEIKITRCSVQNYPEYLSWIHAALPSAEREPLIAEALACRFRHLDTASLDTSVRFALQAWQAGKLVACAYFNQLAGNVATLGGVRAVVDHEPVAAELISQLAAQLILEDVLQIQAVLRFDDQVSKHILRMAGFCPLTNVQHLALELSTAAHRSSPRQDVQSTSGSYSASSSPVHDDKLLAWRPATTLARSRMENLLETTFEQTLDCPALNQVRVPSEVLAGFMNDGIPFRYPRPWQVLLHAGQPVGCLLLSSHPPQVIELTYMALVPAVRRKRMGWYLLEQAVRVALEYNAAWLVAAVDESNWPALKLYERYGFQMQANLHVWWLAPKVSSDV